MAFQYIYHLKRQFDALSWFFRLSSNFKWSFLLFQMCQSKVVDIAVFWASCQNCITVLSSMIFVWESVSVVVSGLNPGYSLGPTRGSHLFKIEKESLFLMPQYSIAMKMVFMQMIAHAAVFCPWILQVSPWTVRPWASLKRLLRCAFILFLCSVTQAVSF